MRALRYLVLAAVIAWPAASWADPVTPPAGDSTVVGSFTVLGGLSGTFFLEFPWQPYVEGAELFNVPLTPADIGRTFRATAESDPDFDDAVAVLTNGVDDYIGMGLRESGQVWPIIVYSETGLLGRPFGGMHPDLKGTAIDALTLRFVKLERLETYDVPAYNWTGELGVEGAPVPTPEPATAVLLLSGCCGLISRRRRCRP
jgi:hypothetical protein